MKPEEFEVYVIPPNFMEGGTLFGGLLKTRNMLPTQETRTSSFPGERQRKDVEQQ